MDVKLLSMVNALKSLINSTPVYYGGYKNYLINGDWSINQTVFAGGALSAGIYGHDGWKADTGGANYTVSGKTVTLTSGTIKQIIVDHDLTSETVTIGVGNPTGTLSIDLEGQTGTITAGSGRRGCTLTVPSGSTGNLTLKVSGTNVSFDRIQLELGTIATRFEFLPAQDRLRRCQRFYEKSYDPGTAAGTNTSAGSIEMYNANSTNAYFEQYINYKVPKYAAGTPHTYSTAGAVDKVRNTTDNLDVAVTIASAGQNGFMFYFASPTANKPYAWQWECNCRP